MKLYKIFFFYVFTFIFDKRCIYQLHCSILIREHCKTRLDFMQDLKMQNFIGTAICLW